MTVNIFITFLNMSISGALAATLLIIWRAVSYKYIPAKFYYLLWMVLMFRLVVPFNLKSTFSILNLFKNSSNLSYGSKYVVTMEYLEYSDLINTGFHQPAEAVYYISVVWLGVSVFMIGLWLFFMVSSNKRLEYSVLYSHDVVKQTKADMALKRNVNVFISPNILSPVVIGFLKPRIILPKTENLSDSDKKYAIAHEMVHIKRYDHIIKALFYFVLAFHWYNPLIWICYLMFNHDMEVSCDQYVLSKYGIEHKSRYAYVLVDYADRKNRFQFGYLSFAKDKVQSRIAKIMGYSHLSVSKAVVFGIVTIAIGLCATTNPVFAHSYQYIPDTVYINNASRAEINGFVGNFIADVEANDIDAITAKSTADIAFFSPVYKVFEQNKVQMDVEKIFYTSRNTADVYLQLTENNGVVFPQETRMIVAQLDSSRIMGGLYVDTLQSYEKYNRINLIDHKDEAIQIVENMIKFGLTDGQNTMQNAPRIAAFCMDIAYRRGNDTNRTELPQKEVENIASEFFLINDFSNLRNTDYYSKISNAYTYDKSIGTYYEYRIIAFDKTEQTAVVTVEFYKDPLHTQVENTVKYTLKKV